jgi:hypothetical protein
MRTSRKIWIGITILILLSPLGLILPAKFGAGSAWGEWSAGELQHLVGYLPPGVGTVGDLWKAPLPDYAPAGQPEGHLARASLWYIVSGVIGVAVVTALAFGLGRLLARREGRSDDT